MAAMARAPLAIPPAAEGRRTLWCKRPPGRAEAKGNPHTQYIYILSHWSTSSMSKGLTNLMIDWWWWWWWWCYFLSFTEVLKVTLWREISSVTNNEAHVEEFPKAGFVNADPNIGLWSFMSGWWLSHPSENMTSSVGVIIPNIWETCSKPPTSQYFFVMIISDLCFTNWGCLKLLHWVHTQAQTDRIYIFMTLEALDLTENLYPCSTTKLSKKRWSKHSDVEWVDSR